MSADAKSKRTKKWIGLAALLVAAFVMGRMGAGHRDQDTRDHASGDRPGVVQEYTCSMHPQIRSTNPNDKCPICGMDLIPVPRDDDGDEGGGDLPQLRVSERAAALMDIQTRPVERRPVSQDIRLFGRVDFDETRLADIVARSEGYIEKLHANYMWQPVRRGEIIAEIYSPTVVTAMRELLVARTGGAATLDAARARLVRLGVTQEQIDAVLEAGEAPRTYQIVSPYDGVVQMVDEREGQWVMEGARIVRVADVSILWVILEAYETDIAWLQTGQPVQFTVAALPGREFEGEINFIDPVVNDDTRTVRLRVETPNPDGLLKPGLFATGQALATLDNESLVIPVSAPLITGRRALVYMGVPGQDRPTFEPRDIVLGPRANGFYVVQEGLVEGDLVVVHGQFKIDSELQIRGRPSMMSPREQTQGPERDIEPVDVSPAFAEQIGSLVQLNFALVDALAGDDPHAAGEASGEIRAYLEQIHSATHVPHWLSFADQMQQALTAIVASHDIEAQRAAFERFSDTLTLAVRAYGSGSVAPVLRAVCPMVHGRDGFWLQPDDDIRNPYFGASMLTCGYIRETLVPDPHEGHDHE